VRRNEISFLLYARIPAKVDLLRTDGGRPPAPISPGYGPDVRNV